MTKTRTDAESFLPLTAVAFEILLAVATSERHGYDIMVAIEQRTDGALSPNPGTLYRAIDRLVRQGLLEVKGRRVEGGERRFFRLSRLGSLVAAAEARRLAGQVRAAQAAQLLSGTARDG